MNIYTVTDPRGAQIGAGTIVKLSKEQSAPRTHVLRTVDEKTGVFEAQKPLEFKAGEVIGVAGTVPKTLVPKIETGAKRVVRKRKQDRSRSTKK
ncbi:hypothetical protein [Hoeflea sp. TYP-13]|uniref:hypothetical protein n=1 Tax=Hoeflea sp. TYP-13 TaxID=3230023 RepID=UPI0034C62219